MVGSYLFPDYRLIFWFLGLFWEVFEHYVTEAANPLDIMWNTIGVIIGIYLPKYI